MKISISYFGLVEAKKERENPFYSIKKWEMCIAFDAWRWWYSTDCQLSDDSKIDWKENEEQALYLFGMEQMQTNNDTYTHTHKKQRTEKERKRL